MYVFSLSLSKYIHICIYLSYYYLIYLYTAIWLQHLLFSLLLHRQVNTDRKLEGKHEKWAAHCFESNVQLHINMSALLSLLSVLLFDLFTFKEWNPMTNNINLHVTAGHPCIFTAAHMYMWFLSIMFIFLHISVRNLLNAALICKKASYALSKYNVCITSSQRGSEAGVVGLDSISSINNMHYNLYMFWIAQSLCTVLIQYTFIIPATVYSWCICANCNWTTVIYMMWFKQYIQQHQQISKRSWQTSAAASLNTVHFSWHSHHTIHPTIPSASLP